MCKKYEDLNEMDKFEVNEALTQYLDEINYKKMKEKADIYQHELVYVDKDIERVNKKIDYFNEKLMYSKDDAFYIGILASAGIVLTQAFNAEKINGMALVMEFILGSGISGIVSNLINGYREKRLNESNAELNDLIELKEDIEERLDIAGKVSEVHKFVCKRK